MDSVSDNTALPSRRRRIFQVGVGHATYAAFSWAFDNVLYLYVVYRLGLLVGGALMTALSLTLCAATLVAYERMRVDWVGAGALERLASLPSPSWWQRLILWADRRGALPVFLALSVFQDAFITTAYFRRGRFDGLRGRDWRVFLGSVLVSNLYWTLRSGVIIAALVAVWRSLLSLS